MYYLVLLFSLSFVGTLARGASVDGKWSGTILGPDGSPFVIEVDSIRDLYWQDATAWISINGVDSYGANWYEDYMGEHYRFRLENRVSEVNDNSCYDAVILLPGDGVNNIGVGLDRQSGENCNEHRLLATGFLSRIGDTTLVQQPKELGVDYENGNGFLLIRVDVPARKKTILKIENSSLIFDLDFDATTMTGVGYINDDKILNAKTMKTIGNPSEATTGKSELICKGNFLNHIPCVGVLTRNGTTLNVTLEELK